MSESCAEGIYTVSTLCLGHFSANLQAACVTVVAFIKAFYLLFIRHVHSLKIPFDFLCFIFEICSFRISEFIVLSGSVL